MPQQFRITYRDVDGDLTQEWESTFERAVIRAGVIARCDAARVQIAEYRHYRWQIIHRVMPPVALEPA